MFKCGNDHCALPEHQVESRQPVNRIVTERRRKQYEKKIRKRYSKKVIGTELVDGWEIIKEITVCPKCFRTLTGRTPKLVLPKPKPQKQQRQRFDSRPPRRNKWQNNSKNPSRKPSSTGATNATTKDKSSRPKPQVETVNSLKVIKG